MSEIETLRNKGTNAIVTGGTQGLGLEVAKQLAREGASNIAIAGRNRERGEAAARTIREIGTNCIFVRADMAKSDDCTALVARSIDSFGSVNALVNSAACTSRGSLLDTSLDLWNEHFDTNVRAPFLTMQGVVRHLISRGEPGSIVNILSMSAYCGTSFLTPYSASKGALATLTKNVANAFCGQGIRCNGVQPGWMNTPGEDATQKKFHGADDDWLATAGQAQPTGQLIDPQHVAVLVAYMLSPQSGVMTGALVDFDQNVFGA